MAHLPTTAHHATGGARRGRRIPAPFTALVAVVTLALGAQVAQASTIDYDHPGGTITITGTAGADDVLLAHASDWDDPFGHDTQTTVGITDFNGATLAPSAVAAGCKSNESYSDFLCPRPARIVTNLGAGDDFFGVYEDEPPFVIPLEVHGGDGNDRIDGASGDDTIRGGTGDDHLTGRGGNDTIYGEDGNDTLNGDFGTSSPGGNDHLDGGAGDDQFEQYVGFGYPASLAGSDTYIGGPGNDSFSYFHRFDAVTVTLDGVANDGVPGEFDNIHPDIETVGGSAGNDVIIGSPGPDRLWGGDGDDTIHGLGGDDVLSGDDGADTLDGGAGNDSLNGGCASDTLIGGPGSDSFYSDSSPNSTCGLRSKRSPYDRIEAADGERDALIFCQELNDPIGDVAIVDAVDPVTNAGPGACGTISIVHSAPAAGGGTTTPGTGGGAPPPLKGVRRATVGPTLTLLTGTGAAGQAQRMHVNLSRKTLTLGTLRATTATRVTATATTRVGKRTVNLGRATVSVPAGATRTVQLRLSPASLRAVKNLKAVRVTTTFTVGKKAYRPAFSVPVLPVDGTRRAGIGPALALWTGHGAAGQAPRMQVDVARRTLAVGTLSATKPTRTTVTATARVGKRTVNLGRTTVVVPAGATRPVQVRLSPAAVAAVRNLKSVRVTTNFTVGKRAFRPAFTVPVAAK